MSSLISPAIDTVEEGSYRNNPHKVLDCTVPLGTEISDLEFVAKVKLTTTSIVNNWHPSDDKFILISTLSGGITNALYIVENTRCNEKVIVRIFGVGTDLFIDRRIENEIFAYLSIKNMGPIFHGLFANGRIEGFINARNLIPNEFADLKITEGIATTMATLHAQPIVLSRESSIWSKTSHILTLLEGVRVQSPSLQLALDSLDIPHLKECAATLLADITDITDTLHSIKDGKSAFDCGQSFALQTAFTHNDLLSGNVLIPLDFFDKEGVDSMRFIDYEYAGYNTRAFDIANHFCEYAGFSFDMDADFPKSSHRRLFIRHYLSRCREQLTGELILSAESEEFVSGVEAVVLKHVLLSHLFWGIWAALQSSMSTIDFDFMGYAQKRIKSYHIHNVEFR